MHSQGDEGYLEQPPFSYLQEKWGGGPNSKFQKLLFAPPILISSPPSFVIYTKVMEALRKPIALNFLFFFLSTFSPILSEICLFRVMGILWKHYGCPGSPRIPFFNKTGGVVASQLAPRFENYYLHPILLNTPPLAFFLVILFS